MQLGDVSLARALLRSLAFSNSTTDFLQILVTSVLSPFEAKSAAILQLKGSRFRVLGKFGLTSEEIYLLEHHDAMDPFLMGVLRANPIVYRDREEFIQDCPTWKFLSASIPGPCVILPFETLEAIQGVVWIKFEGTITEQPLSEVASELVQLAGELVLARFISRTTSTSRGSDLARPLNQREKKVIELARAGLANKQIAREMMVSESWVKKLLQSALIKLGLTSKADLSTSEFGEYRDS